jgi:penicillin amidase
MKRVFKVVGVVILALLLALVAAGFWYRSASQPDIDGRQTVPGLSAPIDIVRDAEGIPHIYAKSADDAYFGLGFVHAQDRLWQLELNRRIPAGRMSEILGPNAIPTDRFLRTLGVRRNAEQILANLAPEARRALEAYARGVNAYLAGRSGPLPPEFILTGAAVPAPWEPVDSLGWQTMMAWDLGANWTKEILRMRLSQKLSLEQINEFIPPYPGDPVQKTMDYTGWYRELTATGDQLAALAKAAPPSHVDGMGSNSWVVGGALSETGKPLLANDPHLGLAAPALWYFAHLSAPGLNVIGATLPGLPAVVLGRNDRVAWGFTNTGPDVQDLFIERVNPDNGKQYQTPDGWAEFNARSETIKVKGQADVTIEVRETRHGPVISGALPVIARTGLDAERYVVAFAWTALRPDDLTLQGNLKFGVAQNWEQFLEGARDFASPQQSIVYADVDGNIGFLAPGRVPVRKPENDLKGLAPAPGWDPRYDWAGFVPFEELPRAYNPESQRIMTANHKIIGDDYPHFLTSEWAQPFRAERINQLLDGRDQHGMDSFAVLQKDHLSLAAVELLPLVRNITPRSQRGREALKRLQAWDGSMDSERTEPLIFNAWMRFASFRIFADELGEPLLAEYHEQKNVHQPMVNVLADRDGQGRWCADVSRKDAVDVQGCPALLADALEDALDDLEQRYGDDVAQWQWGEAHFARSEHRPFARVATLAKVFDIRVPTPGDTYTVNVGRHNLRDEEMPYANRHAASLRALYDLSNLENSGFIHSTGQSGHVLSPHYRDYVQRWARVEYLPMRMQRAAVEQGSIGTLTLAP